MSHNRMGCIAGASVDGWGMMISRRIRQNRFFAFGATIYNQYFEYASPKFKESIYSQCRYYESLYYNLYY